MGTQPLKPNMGMILVAFAVLFGLMMVCARLLQGGAAADWTAPGEGVALQSRADTPAPKQAILPQVPAGSPTPDPVRVLPPLRSEPDHYVVKAGDSLGMIARQFGVSLEQIVQANSIVNPNLLEIGQGLLIPAPTPVGTGPAFKVIPDSEIVYGPASANFDIGEFVQTQGGYLSSYYEEVDGRSLSGAQVIERVAQDFSVNPRLLLAVLEHQSGWVTNRQPVGNLDYPIGLKDEWRKGLYKQIAWAANALNKGYYMWRVNALAAWLLADGQIMSIDPSINAGTAGVQHFFSNLEGLPDWVPAVSEGGFYATYTSLFGSPFAYAVEPLLPVDLTQPVLRLPFSEGERWAFTGGPHGGWADGSAWAALDFAPPSDLLGCIQSDYYVTASADGVIVRAGNGAVVQDLDGDGYEQTGWAILYMHIETRDRVAPGTYLKAGDRIGHPSCEGGVSSGTHVHIARKYNGEWISADQDMPFVLDSWISSGAGYEYDGLMTRGGDVAEAFAGRSDTNGIQR